MMEETQQPVVKALKTAEKDEEEECRLHSYWEEQEAERPTIF